jgi:hypothetical protein
LARSFRAADCENQFPRGRDDAVDIVAQEALARVRCGASGRAGSNFITPIFSLATQRAVGGQIPDTDEAVVTVTTAGAT